MMKIKQHGAMKKWKDKIKNGATYEARQRQIIHKMMKSYLNIGWQTWRSYMVAANTALGLKGNEQKQKHIKLLFAQLEKLTAYLKRQQVEVDLALWVLQDMLGGLHPRLNEYVYMPVPRPNAQQTGLGQ